MIITAVKNLEHNIKCRQSYKQKCSWYWRFLFKSLQCLSILPALEKNSAKGSVLFSCVLWICILLCESRILLLLWFVYCFKFLDDFYEYCSLLLKVNRTLNIRIMKKIRNFIKIIDHFLVLKIYFFILILFSSLKTKIAT